MGTTAGVMTTNRRPRIGVQSGDVAPASYGMSVEGGFYSLEAQAGRPAALILAGALPASVIASVLIGFQESAAEFSRREADVIVLVDMQSPYPREISASPTGGVKTILCEPEIFRRWGFGGDPVVIVIDRASRINAVIDGDDGAAAEIALARVSAMPTEKGGDVVLPAPVLHIPNIFSPELCRDLIAHFEKSAHRPGGMAGVDAQRNAIHKVDEGKKRRNDFVLPATDPYYGAVLTALIRNCLPELKKAFHFDACHTDRILIARYDDTGGYFRRHRDNAAPDVAFRQFALSVNLNDAYEGGHLLFPEYNSHRYRPGAGAGIVFSCSLLHEAAPIAKGSRYVLLTFLHNAEAQARWLATSAKRA
jgi:predicted 2-oxoglutarate/Fe(II)-dependent dioxygenase YbiX